MAGISNAETVTVTPPATYTDGAPIVGTVTINVYTGGVCTGTPYGTGTRTLPPTPPAAVSITGTVLAIGTYSFVANARIGDGTPGACSAPSAWVLAYLVTVSGPAIINEGSTGTFSATGQYTGNGAAVGAVDATPDGWSLWSLTGAPAGTSISSTGVVTVGTLTVDTTITVVASYTVEGAPRTGSRTVTLVNVASTTPGAPSIGTITR